LWVIPFIALGGMVALGIAVVGTIGFIIRLVGNIFFG
jgi:preprotein translocase subunit Sss1